VQRAFLRRDNNGALTSVTLRTYSWPLRGTGMNEEIVRLDAQCGSIESALVNTTLDRTIAVPMGVNLALDGVR